MARPHFVCLSIHPLIDISRFHFLFKSLFLFYDLGEITSSCSHPHHVLWLKHVQGFFIAVPKPVLSKLLLVSDLDCKISVDHVSPPCSQHKNPTRANRKKVITVGDINNPWHPIYFFLKYHKWIINAQNKI